jgi:hypothetical protein
VPIPDLSVQHELSPPPRSDNAEVFGDEDRLGAVTHAQLAEDIGQVVLDGAFGQNKGSRDLAVGYAARAVDLAGNPIALARGGQLLALRGVVTPLAVGLAQRGPVTLGLDHLEQLEQSLIRQALEQAHGNKSRAAELLGLTQHTLLYRMEKYSISAPERD